MAPTADGRLAAHSPSAPRRPCHHPQTRPGQNGWGGPPSQATSPQTPAACHQRQPRGPLALPTDSVCQRQEAGGGWTARWAPSTVGRRGVWEPPSAGPAGDRHATQVLRDPREGPASSLHPGPLAPLSLRTSFGRTHLSMQFVPTPPWHERPHSSRPSGLLSHMESISTLRNRGGGTGGPPRRGPWRREVPRSKCLAPPPTRRPPRPLGTQSGQGTPTLVSVYRSSSPRTLQAREMGPQGGRAGCPETQAGAMRRPLHFCQCLTSWRPTLGYPTAGGYPLCTLTLLMMWGPAQGPRRLVEVHWDPRWEGSGGDGVTGRTDGQGPPSAMCASLTKNTKTGGGGRGPYPNPSSAASTWGPILDGPLWEGMLGVLRSLNL